MDLTGNNLSIEEISDRIIEAVLNERHLNKDSLKGIIKPILKIWLKNTDGVKKYRGKKTPVVNIKFAEAQKRFQGQFWLNVLRKEIGEDRVKPYYDKCNSLLKNEQLDNLSNYKDKIGAV